MDDGVNLVSSVEREGSGGRCRAGRVRVEVRGACRKKLAAPKGASSRCSSNLMIWNRVRMRGQGVRAVRVPTFPNIFRD